MAPMTVEEALKIRPQPNTMFGLTHDVSGNPIVRVPRSVKVSIGLAGGKDVECYIDHDGTWVLRAGEDAVRYPDKAKAQKNWGAFTAKARVRNYPKKLDYFTFSHPVPEGYEPDFDAIELHGPKPKEIDLVFMTEDPLKAEFEMWTKTELKCHGDGINALRVNVMAANPFEKELAEASAAQGSKYFPIIDGCQTKGCSYFASGKCKPSGRLLFQTRSVRLGTTAYFHTTSFRSISQLWSGLVTIKTFTGKGNPEEGFVSGIPLKLALRPFTVVPKDAQGNQGKAATAYGVMLDARGDQVTKLQQALIETGMEYKRSLTATPKQISGDVPSDADQEESFDEANPGAIVAEFYPDHDTEEFNEGRPAGPSTKDADRGSVEAAAEVAERKLSEMRYRQAKEISEIEPDPSLREPELTEPVISHNQMLDMISAAAEHGIPEVDLKQILIKHGHLSGNPNTVPVRLFAEIIEDLQTDKKPRTTGENAPPSTPATPSRRRKFDL